MENVYRVRYNWIKPETEVKNTLDVNEACKACDENPGTTVYDIFGRIIYSPGRGVDKRKK